MMTAQWDDKEVWLPLAIEGYEDVYQVSSFGRVKRVRQAQGTQAGVIKQKTNSRNRYRYVQLCLNGKPKTFSVHRLICLTFVGPPPADGNQYQVAHNDGERDNNCAANLRWATAKENADDRPKHGTHLYGSKIGTSKLTSEDVAQIRFLCRKGVRQVDVAKQFAIHPCYVQALNAGKWRQYDGR